MSRLALGIALLTFGAAAQADPAAWRVRGTDGGDLWLLGSVHYLRERDYPLPDIVDELYSRVDVIVMELDLDDLDPLASQAQFVAAAMLEAGETLPDVLSSQLYELTLERAATLGVDLAMLERFEPWLVAVTLLDVGMSRLGYRPERGIEQYLLRRAVADGKAIVGLETLEAQIRVFDGLSRSDQQALLGQTLAELHSADVAMDDMIAAWRDGRLDELSAALLEEFEDFPALYDSLVAARNARWIDELERLLAANERHLVVVGALHLVGEDNVVDLLAARGHEVSAAQ